MTKGFFVTGTDTGVGKTLVAAAMLHGFAARGLRAVGMKPVAAGCVRFGGRMINEDVVALTAASNVAVPGELINPYCFLPPIAPHLAAEQAGRRISLEVLASAHARLSALADVVVVEGAGGLLVPLNETEDFADLARLLRLPVVMVVGMRLGCLNHALLTALALRARGLELAGWVANSVDPHMAEFDANVSSMRNKLGAPLLGIVPHGPPAAADAARTLDLTRVGAAA